MPQASDALEAQEEALVRMLGALAPAFPVDLEAAVGDRDLVEVVAAEDWRTLSSKDLLERIQEGSGFRPVRAAAGRLDFIGPEDAPAGRAALDERYLSAGVLVAGGLRVGSAPQLAGVLLVDRVDAARQTGTSVAAPHDVEEWATRQARLVSSASPEAPRELAALVLALGGDAGSLALANSAEGALTPGEIVKWAADRDEISILDVLDAVMDARDWQAMPPDPTIHLSDGVLDVKTSTGSMPNGFAGGKRQSLIAEVTALIASAWGCEMDEIEEWEIESEELFDVVDAESVLAFATQLIRPGSTTTL